MTKRQMLKCLIQVCRAEIEAQLPEDEPDCVPTWVIETCLRVGLAHKEFYDQNRRS